eukprot:scaffold97348_cov30-Tisochrysis_lutea.AAC.3
MSAYGMRVGYIERIILTAWSMPQVRSCSRMSRSSGAPGESDALGLMVRMKPGSVDASSFRSSVRETPNLEATEPYDLPEPVRARVSSSANSSEGKSTFTRGEVEPARALESSSKTESRFFSMNSVVVYVTGATKCVSVKLTCGSNRARAFWSIAATVAAQMVLR